MRVKKNMPKIRGLQTFSTARRTIAGFEAMLCLKKDFGFTGDWTANDQKDLLARLFALRIVSAYRVFCDKPKRSILICNLNSLNARKPISSEHAKVA